MPRLSPGEQSRRNEMFTQGFLWCNFCKCFKPTEKFYKAKREPFGYRRYCIECEYPKAKTTQGKSQKKRNRILKRQFTELAGGCCQRCGYSEFMSSLEFHHVDPSNKENLPRNLIYNNNFEATWRELDKCCLFCGNCHAAYGAGEWQAEFIKRDGLGWTIQ